MTDLADFLLARIADDERRVTDGAEGTKTSSYGWHTVDCGVGLGYWANGECTCRYVDHVLAECGAKRRIVEQLWIYVARPDPTSSDPSGTQAVWIVKQLALPYADHPDYREEWRPR